MIKQWNAITKIEFINSTDLSTILIVTCLLLIQPIVTQLSSSNNVQPIDVHLANGVQHSIEDLPSPSNAPPLQFQVNDAQYPQQLNKLRPTTTIPPKKLSNFDIALLDIGGGAEKFAIHLFKVII